MAMASGDPDHRNEWKARFQAVGRAQARYLYVLLTAGVFYWALHVQVTSAPSVEPVDQELPVIGVKVSRVVVWATASTVLGFLVLASLGTFHALTCASKKLDALTKGDNAFERLDTVPTAIDFIVYTKSKWVSRLGLFSYPLFLSVLYVEAWWLWLALYQSNVTLPGRGIFVTVGAVVLLLCVPRLIALWVSKGKKAFAPLANAKGDPMTNISEQTPELAATNSDSHAQSLRVQLAELNTRSRTYTSRIWQVPFAYVGIVGVVLAQVAEKNQSTIAIALASGAIFGIPVLIHLTSLANGARRAVENIVKVERALNLEQTAQYRPHWYVWPLVGLVILMVLVCATGAIFSFFALEQGVAMPNHPQQPPAPGK